MADTFGITSCSTLLQACLKSRKCQNFYFTNIYIFQLQVKTTLQSLNSQSTSKNIALPSTRKQKMAFPPNFVHSLDSTHMMLTALYCQRYCILENITLIYFFFLPTTREMVPFVSVHVCFWTNACFTDKMNKVYIINNLYFWVDQRAVLAMKTDK